MAVVHNDLEATAMLAELACGWRLVVDGEHPDCRWHDPKWQARTDDWATWPTENHGLPGAGLLVAAASLPMQRSLPAGTGLATAANIFDAYSHRALRTEAQRLIRGYLDNLDPHDQPSTAGKRIERLARQGLAALDQYWAT